MIQVQMQTSNLAATFTWMHQITASCSWWLFALMLPLFISQRCSLQPHSFLFCSVKFMYPTSSFSLSLGGTHRRLHLFIHLCCLWLISAESLEPPCLDESFSVWREKKKELGFFFQTVKVFIYHIPGLRGIVAVGHGWLLGWPISDFPLAAVTLFVSLSCSSRLQNIT